jgi:hypothetical protein
MLREQFDIIIGNPPWLSYRYIADPEYQAEIKRRAVERYAIAPRSQKPVYTDGARCSVSRSHYGYLRAACRSAWLCNAPEHFQCRPASEVDSTTIPCADATNQLLGYVGRKAMVQRAFLRAFRDTR